VGNPYRQRRCGLGRGMEWEFVMEAKQCCERVYGVGRMFNGSPCANKAKVERDGNHYCTVHDPVRVKEKIDARNAKWQAQRAKDRTEREEAAALEVEMKRRYDCHDALVEALKLCACVLTGADMSKSCLVDALEKARVALALAGETP
jgi:hypothetical protein